MQMMDLTQTLYQHTCDTHTHTHTFVLNVTVFVICQSEHYKRDHAGFIAKAKEWCRLYAQEQQTHKSNNTANDDDENYNPNAMLSRQKQRKVGTDSDDSESDSEDSESDGDGDGDGGKVSMKRTQRDHESSVDADGAVNEPKRSRS